MTVLGHAAPFSATKTLATAMRWLAVRIAVYAAVAIGVTSVFVGASAFYAFVWLAPAAVHRSVPKLPEPTLSKVGERPAPATEVPQPKPPRTIPSAQAPSSTESR